jgi:hypothetical protein
LQIINELDEPCWIPASFLKKLFKELDHKKLAAEKVKKLKALTERLLKLIKEDREIGGGKSRMLEKNLAELAPLEKVVNEKWAEAEKALISQTNQTVN